MLLVVEDSQSRTKIVGVGILANEDRVTLKWFFECFQKQNADACHKIRCFMSDKDLTERSVMKEVFPGIPTYICLFHTLKTFSREVALNKMNISSEERVTSLKYLDRLAKSTSSIAYDKIYEEFSRDVPKQVFDYFNKNWHGIRSEWTLYSMVDGNLGNTTNNRLESLNSKIKQVIQRKSTMVAFVKSFFKFLDYRKHEITHKRVQEFLKKDAVTFETGSAESSYKAVLTSSAFAIVISEIKKSNLITFKTKDPEKMMCTIGYQGGEVEASTFECTCPTWTSSLLPCRHIFAVRRQYCSSLFDETLCRERWTKCYSLKVDPLLNVEVPQNDGYVNTASTISKVVKPQSRTAAQKKSVLNPILNELLHTACNAPDSTFDHKLSVLKQIQEIWHQGYEVCVMKAGATPQHSPRQILQQPPESEEIGTAEDMSDRGALMNIEKDMANLSMRTENGCEDLVPLKKTSPVTRSQSPDETSVARSVIDADSHLGSLELPSAVKLIGRPKRALSATLQKSERIVKPTPFSEKTIEVKQRAILGWLIAPEMVSNVMNQEYKVTLNDIRILRAAAVSDAIVDESADITIVKAYFEDAAFEELHKLVQMKKRVGLFTCPTCGHMTDTDIVFCDSCLHWIHFKCASIKRSPRTRFWFCSTCHKRQ